MKRVVIIILTGMVLSGCANTDNVYNNNQSKSINLNVYSRGSTNISKLDTSLVDKYLNGQSYKELTNENKKDSLFNKVRLKEPLEPEIGDIEETLPDYVYENSTEEDLNMEEITYLVSDKNKLAFEIDQYIQGDLIGGGYLLVYSANDENIEESMSKLKHLKIYNEKLETINEKIQVNFNDDTELLANWNSLYQLLLDSKEIVSSMQTSEDLLENCRNLEVEKLYDLYSSFYIYNKIYCLNYIPNGN